MKIELTEGLAASEVVERLLQFQDNESEGQRGLAFYLHDMRRRKLYRVSGHRGIGHFAETHMSIEPRRAQELAQIGCALRGLVKVDEAFRTGRISWSHVQRLLPVVELATQVEWIEAAAQCTLREFRAAVRGHQRGDLPGDADGFALPPSHFPFGAEFNLRRHLRFEELRRRLSAKSDHSLTNLEMLDDFMEKELGDWEPEQPEAPLPPEQRNRDDVPAETQHEVLRRDNYRCRNCHAPHDPHIHHLQPRAQGGSNEMDNLLTLCRVCHGLTHDGLLFPTGHPNDPGFTFLSQTGQPVNEKRGRPRSRPPGKIPN